jgi:hypothetical protein
MPTLAALFQSASRLLRGTALATEIGNLSDLAIAASAVFRRRLAPFFE